MMHRKHIYKAYDKINKNIKNVLCIDWLNGVVDLEGGVIERLFDQKNSDNNEVKLMEYSSFKDKQCIAVYEDYIVEVDSPLGKFLAKVVYEGGSFGLVALKGIIWDYFENNWNDHFITLLDIYWNNNDEDNIIDSIKIFGNIHENKELLKGEL